MGNESSTTEALPEEGAREHVVLVPPQENHTEPLQTEAQKNAGVLLTQASTSQQSLLSQPVLLDVPVISGVEESRGTSEAPEDKEELEFPHDLLPSLDFTSDLNIWESSLGLQSSTAEGSCEQVNPLLAGLQHHMEVSHPLVVLDGRPHGADPLLADAPLSPQPLATPHPVGQYLTPPSRVLLDQELLAAFQECEEQMASLSVSHLKEPISTKHEKVDEEDRKPGPATVTKCDESSSLPHVADRSGHGNSKLINKSTHGNSETGSSQMDTVVFSFRDYILGRENPAPEEITKEAEQNQTGPDSHSEKSLFEQMAEGAILNEANVDCNAATGDISTQDCNRDNVEEDIDRNEVVDLKIGNQIPTSTINPSHTDANYSVHEFSESKSHYSEKQDVLEDDAQMVSASSEQCEPAQNRRMKKRDKKKHKKKKRVEMNNETKVEDRMAAEAEKELQSVSFINTGNHCRPEPNASSVSDRETMMCGAQLNDGFCRKGTPSPSHSSHSQQGHFIDLACSTFSLVSSHANQSDDINVTDAQCGKNNKTGNNPQRTQHTTASLINKQRITHVQTTADVLDKASEYQSREDNVSTEAQIHKLESSFCSIPACVGESCVERAIEDAFVEVAALPLTTPTMREVIKSEGERVSCDSWEGVATKAIAGIGKGEPGRQPEGNGEKKSLLDTSIQLSSVCCTPRFPNELRRAVSEESCDSRMPHASAESCSKGEKETSSAEAAISPAGEGDREKEPLCFEENVHNFPHGILATGDHLSDCTAGLEGGGVAECSSFSLPEGAARGVSVAEKKPCPAADVAESCVKSPSSGGTITDSPCTKEDLTAAFSPLPPQSEQSNAESGVSTQHNLKSEEPLCSGTTCEVAAITETSLATTSDNQQVQSETGTPKSTATKREVNIQEPTQTTNSTVGKSLHDQIGGCNRVRFVDSVKEDHSVTREVRNMPMPASGCASLPPLTVHESLYHPVVEASYIYPDFLSLKKPETSSDISFTKDEAVFQIATPMSENGVLVGTQDTFKNAESDLSGEDRKRPTEKNFSHAEHGDCVETARIPTGADTESAKSAEEPRELTENELNKATKESSEQSDWTTKHLKRAKSTGEQPCEKTDQMLTKQQEVVIEKAIDVLCLTPKEFNTPEIKMDSKEPIQSDNPEELLSDVFVVKERESSVSNATSKIIGDVLTKSPDRQLPSDLDSIANSETGMLACSISPQTKLRHLSCQPVAEFDQHAHALVSTEPVDSRQDLKSVTPVGLRKGGSVVSGAMATEQSISVCEQNASHSTSMLQPRGLLLSNLDVVDEFEVAFSEGIGKDNANCDSTETHLSFVDDQEREEANDEVARMCLIQEGRNDTECITTLPSDSKVTPLEEEKQHPECVLGNDTSHDVTHATPNVIIDICPLSSNKPNGTCDNTELCGLKEKQNMSDKTSVSLKCKTEELNNQKETVDGGKLPIGNMTPQQNEDSDKDAKEGTGDLSQSHKFDIQSTEPNIVDHLKSEIQSELHDVFDQYLPQILAETVEHQDNRDTATDFSSNPELNSLARQQEQPQQDLLSKYSTDGWPGGCVEAFEEGAKTNSRVKAIQAPFSEVTEVVGRDWGSFEKSESQGELSRDDGGITEQAVGVEKVEMKESQVSVCDLTDSRHSTGQNILEQAKKAHVDKFGHDMSHDTCGLAEEGSGTDLMHDKELRNSMESQGKTESKHSDLFEELQGNDFGLRGNTVSAEPFLADLDISPLGLSVSEKESTRSNEYDTAVSPSETEKYKIPDRICKSLESQCSNISSAPQNASVAQTPIKGPHVDETAGRNKVAVDEEIADFSMQGTSEVKVEDDKATKKNGPRVTVVAQDNEPSSANVSNHACHHDCNFSQTMDHDDDPTRNPQPNVAKDTPSVPSKTQDDDPMLSQAAFPQSEKLPNLISLPTPLADDVVHPLACDSDFEHARTDTEASHMSDNSAGLTTQEPDPNWITALREAASDAQTEQESAEIPRALPSLESPQQEFLTPTEAGAIPLGPEKIPQEQTDTTTSHPELDLAGQLEEAQKVTEIVKKEEDHIEEYSISRAEISADQTELSKPAKIPGELVELDKSKLEKESLEKSPKITEHLEPNKPIGEHPEEKSKNPAEESTEAALDPTLVLQKIGPPLTEQPERSAALPISSPRHLPTAPLPELPTPSPASPSPEKTPPASPHQFPLPPAPASPLAPSSYQSDNPCPTSASCRLLPRSSDSDGAFETPESTTPVKAPADPQNQLIPTDDKGEDTSVRALSSDAISEPLAIVFDEDRPIAASGTYNIEHFASETISQPLTRSLSLQGGELDTSGLDGSATQGFRPHSESFSVGTDSNPGTLRKPRKVRPASVKKKPLLRQNSNPEKPSSTISTPEIIKRAKHQTVTPEGKESRSPAEGGSPAGTLRKTRTTRVDTPPPLPEENTHIEPEPSLTGPALHLCREENRLPASPPVTENLSNPPSGSYKWDPENFESIDPFKTGGSKIANSPVLGRKGLACAPIVSPPESPPIPAVSQLPHPASAEAPVTKPEEQPLLPKRESVRLEFDYSEENSEASHGASPPLKKPGKKPGAKMPLRKPKSGLKKAHPGQTEQLDNNLPAEHNGNEEEKPISRGSYDFESNKWDDPNFNPFLTKTAVANSPKASGPNYSFDFDDSIVDPFKSSNKMATSPPKASASFEMSSNDDMENDNDNIGELEDQNQNKPAKKKKTPIKSRSRGVPTLCCLFNTFRVKRSPKKSQLSDNAQDADDPAPLPPQDGHATDEEKLASSTNHKWAGLHDVDADLNSDQQDFPHPSDLTSFVNESGLQSSVQDYEIEYIEKIGSSSSPPSVKKPSLYLKLDSLSNTATKDTHGSEPNSPCTGSFEEMEAQITASMKTPVLNSRPGPEGCAGEKGRKRESEVLSRTQSTERDEQLNSQEVPSSALTMSLLERLSECDHPVQYLEPDLAETNPNAFAQKLQEELVLAALRIEALQVAKNISQCPSLSTVTPQHRDVSSPSESSVSKNMLYARTANNYIDGESPHLPKDLDHSLGIAKEEIVTKEREALEWQRKYEDSRQEVQEMRRIVSEYEKTIAQMIGMPEDDQKEKSLSHHTIQQLIIEKDQALADLNSVEKSLADLFRRYEKMKDVLEGFRKNEDVLKKCAQEYLSRVRKEEQRYQALKIHAEEKLDRANAEIAQVRAKSKQEQAAHQASLRKEQMKVDSLERTLEQKNKEIEELTKICDELIAKMGKC
ncbi:uncharacterized protein tacc2 isoform X3 [Hippocampus comes]|uniref:uncharacterized protein tacc2 isoform X3 n=1 Tax=Hippocampus comes TaxID=109280 RepID=UPI00094E90C4|nr:PREDICTED: uncharacterized protein LOC109516184 isoform X3 [Hippocampus comes]XP_019726050.1 PREDICTED: uncharacterized protein LOC109516184 isoform X3 [Hippocampus comes]